MLRSPLRLAAALALTCAGAEALAQPATPPAPSVAVALNWVRMPGAESCISPQALARGVEQRVGHPVFVPVAQAEWSIEGRVERDRDAWLATLRASRGDGVAGSRTVRRVAPDCAVLDAQVAVIIALLIDPEADPNEHVAPPAPPTPPPAPPPPPPPAPPPQPLPAPAPAAPAARPRHLTLELGVGAAVEALPTLAPAAHLAAEWSPGGGPLRLRAAAGVWGPAQVTVAPASAARGAADARFVGLHGALSACLAPASLPWLSACLGALVGGLHGEGASFARDASVWRPAVAATSRVGVEASLSARWSLRGGLWVGVPVVWPEFVVADPVTGQSVLSLGPSAPVTGGLELAVAWAAL